MEDGIGQEPEAQVVEPQAPEAQPGNSPEEQQSNPFWGEIEKLTGPNVYRTIQPHLAKADTEARNRISELNSKYEPWKEFSERGVTPDHVRQAFGYVQQLQSPEGQVQLYESLRNFLQENGRLPNEQELNQQISEDLNEGDPNQLSPEAQRIAQLEAQLAQFGEQQQNFFQAQENERIQQEASVWADNEWNRVIQAHPDLTKEDLQDVAQILAAQTNQGMAPDIDKAVATFAAMRDRIRTTPRPGQLAPRLPSGPGGGNPSAPQIDPSKLTKEQRIELAASRLQAGRN